MIKLQEYTIHNLLRHDYPQTTVCFADLMSDNTHLNVSVTLPIRIRIQAMKGDTEGLEYINNMEKAYKEGKKVVLSIEE